MIGYVDRVCCVVTLVENIHGGSEFLQQLDDLQMTVACGAMERGLAVPAQGIGVGGLNQWRSWCNRGRRECQRVYGRVC